MKSFPKLKFYHNELNYTFELDYNDLFIEENDKLILMVFLDEIKMTWSLGKPFLKKYSFLFNQDTKFIGFYIKKEINIDISDNNVKKIVLKICFIAFSLILLFILGIEIGKYYFGKKKKPLNVLEEDYDYKYESEEKNNDILFSSKS